MKLNLQCLQLVKVSNLFIYTQLLQLIVGFGFFSAAQEAGAPHKWVINRKNKNAIFTYT